MRPVGPDDLPPGSPPPRWQIPLLGMLALGSLAGAFFLNPVPQDPAYHDFADQRRLLGIPNFLDVVSNLPFLVAGLLGLCNLFSERPILFVAPWTRVPWSILMAGIFCTGIGSAYYHWAPSDHALFWDRLPMAVAFSAAIGIVVIERVDRTLGAWLWVPLLLSGVASLLFWRLGGDLRFYGLLQGWALTFIPLMLLLFPGSTTGTHHWVLSLACYLLAKVFEFADDPIFRAGGLVSGHSLKHLAAGAGSWFLVRHLQTRVPRGNGELK